MGDRTMANGTGPQQVPDVADTASTTSTDLLVNSEIKMSEEANVHVRNKYRDLIQTFQEHTSGAGEEQVTLETLHSMLQQANEAFAQVNRPREAAIDAQLLKTCGTLAKVTIESAQSNLRVFKPTEFARRLIAFASPDDESAEQEENLAHLVRMGKAVSGLYKTAVGVEPMYSTIEWERPAKPPPRPRKPKDSEVAAVTKPTEVVSTGTEEEGEAEVVSRMYRVLKQRYIDAGNTSLCFFSFVVNPNSYSQTVENIFNTSLLVREQLAALSEDKQGLPVITPLQKDRPQVGGTCKQCIISLSKSEWEDIVKTFDIKSAMIPPVVKRAIKRK